MSATSTDTAVYNPQDDGVTASRFLGSSLGTLSPSRSSNSQFSKAYKQARDLFLTRRLAEAYSTIEPLVSLSVASDDDAVDEETSESAPIAQASRNQRIKVWSLHLTLLNAIHELGPEEGKAQFGSKDWRRLTSKAWDGSIWDEVVNSGYRGVEGNVDPEVVINLATLLLAQSPSQAMNQQRLETYLSASSQPNLDLYNHFHSPSRTGGLGNGEKHTNGTDTPQDLASRVKILELYALHVLPRNEEWQYAQDFIKLSEILDDDTRDAFLQSLNDLQDQKNGVPSNELGVPQGNEIEAEQHQQQLQELEPRHEADEAAPPEKQENADDSETTLKASPQPTYRRAHSEHDYGIETPKSALPPSQSSLKPSTRPPQAKSSRSPPTSSRKKPASSPPGMYKRSAIILLNLQNLIKNMTQSLSKNPMALLRFVFFLLGLIVALSRRDVKDRLAMGWDKVRRTIGMGVKVSYI